MLTSLLKDIIKDKDEQSGEGIPKLRSGRFLSAGASVPVDLGCFTLPIYGCVHQPKSSLNSVLLGILWRLRHIGVIDH